MAKKARALIGAGAVLLVTALGVVGTRQSIPPPKAPALGLTLREVIQRFVVLEMSGNFAAQEEYQLSLQGQRVQWEDVVRFVFEEPNIPRYSVELEEPVTFKFTGDEWRARVLSLRKGDYIRASGIIEEVFLGTIWVNAETLETEVPLPNHMKEVTSEG